LTTSRALLLLASAAEMASRPPWRAEKMLNAELERPIDALHWQGVSDSAVERQVKAFEAAIRTELWRIVLLPPSPDMRMTSRPEESHRRALPEPCMTLSSHTAPDVRPLP